MDIKIYVKRVKKDLFENILPFWIKHTTDMEYGGYYGHINNKLKIDACSPKGSIQHSRILWTYSSAYRLYGDPEYLSAAKHAFEFLTRHMIDEDYGGVYMLTDRSGNTYDDKKWLSSYNTLNFVIILKNSKMNSIKLHHILYDIFLCYCSQ